MTREEAKQMFKEDKDAYRKPRAIMTKIDKIFDEFEQEKEDLKEYYKDYYSRWNVAGREIY